MAASNIGMRVFGRLRFPLSLRTSRLRFVWVAVLFSLLFVIGAEDLGAKTKKRKAAPRREPELKIVDLAIAPLPYRPDQGALDFTVTVQLPNQVDDGLMLEVSSLVTSPSMTSLRFLTSRQPVTDHQPATASNTVPKRVEVQLSWDGLDHNKQLAPSGSYDYMVRAKLLSNGEKGQKTQMLSWPKRGTFVIK